MEPHRSIVHTSHTEPGGDAKTLQRGTRPGRGCQLAVLALASLQRMSTSDGH